MQLPLPAQIDADAVMACISPEKDADGFHPYNFGRLAEGHPAVVAPGTPLGCMELLRRSDLSDSAAAGRWSSGGAPSWGARSP